MRLAFPAACAVAACICAVLLTVRMFLGPFGGPVPIHSPLNLEGIFALLVLLTAALRSRKTPIELRGYWPGWVSLAVIAILILGAFGRNLSFPLLADDYPHIWNARHITWNSALAHFTQPEPDRFFRPLVYWAYGLEAPFAGLNPAIWRSISLMWHVAASLLVYGVLRAIHAERLGAFAGAALFAVHGARPEAVFWVAARFDLMAATFGLLALWLLLKWRTNWSLAALIPALLCKESAFVFPLLALLFVMVENRSWTNAAKRLWGWFAAAAVVFAWRLHVLGEIGGYHNTADGRPTIFNLRLSTTLKGFFVRAWAALMVPLNWTDSPDIAISLLGFGALLTLVWFAWRGGNRKLILTGLAVFLIAALPVHQFLSIGDDLEKSRVLYLPSLGFAMVLAGLTRGPLAVNLLGIFLAFHLAALDHNLAIWQRTGILARQTCQQAESPQGYATVPDMPNVVDGVYFLKTGYPHCAWLDGKTTPAPQTLHWDDKTRRLR